MKAYNGTEIRLENGKWIDEEGTEYVSCYECGEHFPIIEMTQTTNGLVCKDCREDEYFFCDRCEQWHPLDDMREVLDMYNNAYSDYMCEDCADIVGTYCPECGKYYQRGMVRIDVGSWHYGEVLCTSCREELELEICEECGCCGEIVSYDERTDQYLCDGCWEGDTIKSYGKTKFLPYFGDDDDLHMGIELEIDKGGKDDDNAQALIDILGENTAECKEDGSLNDGFEIASAPATYEAHKNELDWENMMKKAVRMGYSSHDANTCGLHVHVDRAYFINTLSDADCENKFALLFGNNADWIKRFSRRTNFHYCEIEDQACQKTTPQDAKKGDIKSKPNKYARYVAINYNTSINTIEFRIFRGTLKYNTFIATLQFVQMFCDFVNDLCPESLASVGMFRFMQEAKTRGYEEFLTYLEERGLTD